jgi:mono/diheme cytochrome c family protein
VSAAAGLVALLVGGAALPAGGAAAFEGDVLPLLQRSCHACHNPALRNADLDLTRYETEAQLLADPKTWEKVVEKTRTRQMPPVPFPPLAEAEVALVTGWVEAAFARHEAASPPNPGRVTARRLNRTEYDNTVRDLLGVELRPALDFPQDDTGYGFDNNGDVLSLSPALMERYLTAAERVARAALFGPDAPKPSLVRLESTRARVEPSPVVPAEYDESGLSMRNAVHAVHRVSVTGDYVVRAILGGERPAGSEPVEVGFFVDDREQGVLPLDPEGMGSFSSDRQDFSGKTRELRVRLAAGEHRLSGTIVRIFEGLPPQYGGPSPSRRPQPPPPEFKPPKRDPTAERIAAARAAFEKRLAEKAPANDVRVTRLEVLGPYEPVRGPSPASARLVYGAAPRGALGEASARPILARLARRAYRRPVSAAEIESLVGLVARARARGERAEAGLALAIQALLVSPDFLFRVERGRPAATGEPGRGLTDHELASRLSYFLWVSMPDDALLDLADQGLLSRPDVLETQVLRMLRDPKAAGLVEAFAGQWLQFRGLDGVTPDKERFPDFDSGLRLAMRRETELFVGALVREDGSLLDLVGARHSYLNERLARHYGIAGVRGPEFRRVELDDPRRGGVLTHASVLTVSSYATRTSPVLRGKWILENILDAPPPDPPAGVPRLDEAKVGGDAPLREQLVAHRTQPMCAACHEKMDPLGFSLESYDAIGAFRTTDGKWPIDASGALPDGRRFEGASGLASVLLEQKAALTRAFASKLLTFALGRGLERYDRRALDTITQRVAANDYRFSALVLEVVRSLPFQRRKEEEAS